MVYLKECPRCNGDLYDRYDLFGYFISCIQCGYELSYNDIVVLNDLKISNDSQDSQRDDEAAALAPSA